MLNTITNIDRDSPARGKVKIGDELLSINGHGVEDVLDYRYWSYEPRLSLVLRSGETGREYTVKIRKDAGEDLGLDFEEYLMDKPWGCSNRCLFCFIDQLPRGLRRTLYFKDDDARLSFLTGSYITLTNLSEREMERICALKISPINVSVHATDPELRAKLMGNPKAADIMGPLRRLTAAGITVDCQIVCCPGYNDKEQLSRSMRELSELYPGVNSVSIVPVGLTKHRQGLAELTPFDKDSASETIDRVEKYAAECLEKHGSRIFWCSDELYLKAGREVPEDEYYEEYSQLENGVGMMRLFEDEFRAELDRPHRIYGTKQIDVVTGTMAGPLITEMMDELHRQYPMIDVKVHVVKNNFFGGNVGVAGLVTATDIIAQCEGKLESGTLGIPAVMLREEKDTFLDDVTIAQLGERLGVKVEVLPVSGGDEAKALLRTGLHISRRRRA